MQHLSYFKTNVAFCAFTVYANPSKINACSFSLEGGIFLSHLFSKLGGWIQRHAAPVLAVLIILTVIIGAGITHIKMTMGNEMFVSTHGKLYRDSQTYAKHFDGDAFVIMVQSNQNKATNAATFKKVAAFERQARQIKNISTATSIVDILNQTLAKGNASSLTTTNSSQQSELQKNMLSELTAKQQRQLQAKLQASLTAAQQKQVSAYTTGLLTTTQKQKMATAETQLAALPTAQQAAAKAKLQASLSTSLNADQQQKLQTYLLSILNTKQQSQLAQTVMTQLPHVQQMHTSTLQALLYSNHGQLPSSMQQLLPKNGKYILINLPTNPKASMTDYQTIYPKLNHALKQSGLTHNGYHASIAGNPAVSGTVGKQIMHSMMIMLAASVVIMILILLLVFPVRRRLLPLLVVLFGIIWTFGLMGWLNIKLTMATMATLPIIIGLGTDFGVQFLNRYEEEFRQNHSSSQAIHRASKYTGPAVGTAVIVMIFSFLTMHLSKAPMMQDFGTTLAIGVAVCYVIELFLLFAILALADRHQVATTTIANTQPKISTLNRLLGHYAKWVMHHATILVIIGAIVGVVGFIFEGKLGVETDIMKMIPQDMTAMQANKKLIKTVGSQTRLTYLVTADDVRDQKVVHYLENFGQQEKQKYGAGKIASVSSLATTLTTTKSSQTQLNQAIAAMPHAASSQLISSNHHAATLTITLNKHLDSADGLQLMNNISKDAKAHPAGLKIAVVGQQAMLLQGISNMTANHGLIIISGLAIIFVVLLLVYRKFKDALYPILPIVIVLGLSPLTLYLLGISYNPVTIALSSLVLGIGTEFTILILERYKEERHRGAATAVAIETALASVGQAITVSGLTVIGGFSTLMFVNFPVLRSFGLITVLDTAYSLIMALTIMPAVIYLFRKRNN